MELTDEELEGVSGGVMIGRNYVQIIKMVCPGCNNVVDVDVSKSAFRCSCGHTINIYG